MKVDEYQNNLITSLQFTPKENSVNIYQKKYVNHNNYIIEIDFDKNIIDFGESIFFNDSKNYIQNITKDEDLVVFECVDRLLVKNYAPKNIILEKVYPSGHGTSGRLDILVTRDDGSAYMMIECKTWSKEFDTAFKKLQKDGGQLFTYFQQDKDAEVLVLYASQLNSEEIEYTNQIIKIEDEYKSTSNVKDFYDRWNKTPKNNGVFDTWATAYNYESKALTPKELIEITSEDSSKIFNRFMEILRHNVVSDKPNAFSKIFTLFLCKIMDEKATKPDAELGFQWIDGKDTHISFQKRLTDLYQKGMKEFLDKEVTDLSDEEFEEKFGDLDNSLKERLLEEFTKIRLQKNNEFAIKDVFDQDTFEENAIVVKEVVELLQNYQIRYTKKQQFLSDFFELLLTTGLKQEVGQFFTPVPVAKFIIRSIPFDKIIQDKLSKGVTNELLPNVIDYAVGSGHFITEAMDEIQKYIMDIDTSDFISDVSDELEAWKIKHFNWAYDYVYGIEKDYRLVKTAKVGCYLHGDGLAKVIHGDGLSNFTNTKEFKGKLVKKDKNYPQDNKQFDLVISNPPYSVSAFKNISKKFTEDDFELYEKLTDQSSEIEALFIERTKQLLKDDGIAGIILPSSILNNGGIYTKTREIILKYFDIVSITELGSNTFMATGTNTVVLFLRRKNNAVHTKIELSVGKIFADKKDGAVHGIEKPLKKYVNHTWEDIGLEDYLTLLDKNPNEKMKAHEIYQEYEKKLGNFEKMIELEKEKVFYFIMAYSQKVTLVKTGDKKDEKRFLGYEFSARRGSEGIRPTQRGKTIDECTSLYDDNSYKNYMKANSYIYSAFNCNFKEIDESLKDNISYIDLVDMMTFDRVDFEKNISLNIKKKVNIESKWEQVTIANSIVKIVGNTTKIPKDEIFDDAKCPVVTQEVNSIISGYTNNTETITDLPLIIFGDHSCSFKYIDFEFIRGADGTVLLKPDERFIIKYYYFVLDIYIRDMIENKDSYERHYKYLQGLKIPLPPKSIQEKILKEIKSLEEQENKINKNIKILEKGIADIIDKSSGKLIKLEEITTKIGSGATPRGGEGSYKMSGTTLIRSQNVHDTNFTIKGLAFIDEEQAKKLNNVTVKKNDILFNITGASIARCCIVDDRYLPARVNQHVSIIRTKKIALSKYVQMTLVSREYKNKLLDIGDGGTSREAITKIQLEEFKIPLPSIEEQKEIVKQIETIERKMKIKEQELLKIPQEKEKIMEKYLK